MYAASSKLGSSSGCLLSAFSSYRKWAHHLAARLPLQQRSSWVAGQPRWGFTGLQGSAPALRVAPAQLTARRRLAVSLQGNGSTNADGMHRPLSSSSPLSIGNLLNFPNCSI
jgi:hypothetical protein